MRGKRLFVGVSMVVIVMSLLSIGALAVPTLISYQGKLNNATTGDPFTLASLRINITELNNISAVVWNLTFDNVTDQFGVFSIILGKNKTLNLTPGKTYQLVAEVDLGSAEWVRADIIYGDLNPASDDIRITATGPTDATELLLSDNTTSVEAEFTNYVKRTGGNFTGNLSVGSKINFSTTGDINLSGFIHCSRITGSQDNFCSDDDTGAAVGSVNTDKYFLLTGTMATMNLTTARIINLSDSFLKTLNVSGNVNISANLKVLGTDNLLSLGWGNLTGFPFDFLNFESNFTSLNRSIIDMNNTLQRIDLVNLTNLNKRLIALNTTLPTKAVQNDTDAQLVSLAVTQNATTARLNITQSFAVDTNTFYVDDITNRVGIGVLNNNNTNVTLQVMGNASFNDTLFVTEQGKVGIGTSNPAEKLHISGGNIKINSSSSELLDLKGSGTSYSSLKISNDVNLPIWVGMWSSTAARGNTGFLYTGAGANLSLWSGGVERVTILTPSGNMGIRTISPTTELDVLGRINASRITIENADVCLENGSNCVSSFSKAVQNNTDVWFKSLNITGAGTNITFISTNDALELGINVVSAASAATISSFAYDGDNSWWTLNDYVSGGITIMNWVVSATKPQVGIGLINPQQALDVVGNVTITQNLNVSGAVNAYNITNLNARIITLNTSASGGIQNNTDANLTNLNVEQNVTVKRINVSIAAVFGNVTGNGTADFLNSDPFGVVHIGSSNSTNVLTLSVSNISASTGTNGSLITFMQPWWRVNQLQVVRVAGIQSFKDSGPSTFGGGLMLLTQPATGDPLQPVMTLKASGYVGIGTISPTHLLTLGNNSRFNVSMTGEANMSSNLLVDSGTLFVDAANNNVGIGTTGPAQTLTVQGNVNISGNLNVSNNILVNTTKIVGDVEVGNASTIGSRLNFSVSTKSGYIDYGIKKAAAENRFAGIRVNEIINDGTNLYGTLQFFTDAEGVDFSTERMRITGRGNVGIGTTAPKQALVVQGDVNISGKLNVSDLLFVNASNVGIGTSTPNGKLEVSKTGTGTIEALRLTNPSGSVGDGPSLEFHFGPGGSDIQSKIYTYAINTNTGDLRFATASGSYNDRMTILSSGNVGIGTTGPAQTLTVQGSANISGNLNVTGAQPASSAASPGVAAAPSNIVGGRGGDSSTAAVATGGIGSSLLIAAGNGGNATSTATGGSYAGGKGGTITLIAGAGGNQSFDNAIGFNTGGKGGDIVIGAGLGGNASGNGGTHAGGAGGNVYIYGGPGAASVSTKGVNGSVLLGISSDGQISNVGVGTITTTHLFSVANQTNMSSSGEVNISNDLLVDSGTLYVDSANNNVGIGTVAPVAKLEIKQASTSFYGLNVTNAGSGIYSYVSNPASGSMYAGYFSAYDGAPGAGTSRYGLFANSTANGGTGTINYGIYSTASGAATNYAAIFNGGNVGIGTTTPSAKLQIDYQDASSPAEIFGINSTVLQTASAGSTTTYAVYGVGANMGSSSVGNAYGGYFVGKSVPLITPSTFGVYANASGGRIGYGIYATASGAGKNFAGYFDEGDVYVVNNLNVTGITSVCNGDCGTVNLATGAGDLYIEDDLEIDGVAAADATAMQIDANGQVTKATSSRKYKTEIKPYLPNTSKILSLKPSSFKWNNISAAPGIKSVGLIAEEVEEIMPDVVYHNNDGSPESVNYDKISLFLIQAYKEQQEENQMLKQELCKKDKEYSFCE